MDVAGGRAYFENWADVSWGCSLFGLTTIFLGQLSFRLYSFGLTTIFLVARSFSALFPLINYHFLRGHALFGIIHSD